MTGTTPWPVTGQAEFTRPDHPDLRFAVVTDGVRCSVHALEDLIVLGSLRWLIREGDDDTGTIGFVYVTPTARRRGIATALLEAATSCAAHHGWPAPRHSTERSIEGDAWAQALGAPPATSIIADSDILTNER